MNKQSETRNIDAYEARRESLRERYLDAPATTDVITAGVDHLALISSDLERTVDFYTGVVSMRLTKVVRNRDEPTSTHIFLDMGGGNQLAFFDFPTHGPEATVRGVGSMHHVALKATSEHYQRVLQNLARNSVEHSVHGDELSGSVYFRDPDGILLEVTTGYD